jgi:hypothetical protein
MTHFSVCIISTPVIAESRVTADSTGVISRLIRSTPQDVMKAFGVCSSAVTFPAIGPFAFSPAFCHVPQSTRQPQPHPDLLPVTSEVFKHV